MYVVSTKCWAQVGSGAATDWMRISCAERATGSEIRAGLLELKE